VNKKIVINEVININLFIGKCNVFIQSEMYYFFYKIVSHIMYYMSLILAIMAIIFFFFIFLNTSFICNCLDLIWRRII